MVSVSEPVESNMVIIRVNPSFDTVDGFIKRLETVSFDILRPWFSLLGAMLLKNILTPYTFLYLPWVIKETTNREQG